MSEYHHKLPNGEDVCTQHLTMNNFDTWHLSIIVSAKKMDCLHFLRGPGPDTMSDRNDASKKSHLYQIIMATIPLVITFLKHNGFDVYETEPFRLFGAIEKAMEKHLPVDNKLSSTCQGNNETEWGTRCT